MNTCKNCEYWDHIRDEDEGIYKGPHGVCLRINSEETENAWLWGEEVAEYPDSVQLITQPTFSCPLFTEKT